MEEIRQSIIKLQEKFKKLAIADEAIKDVINCNSKNLEALKHYTLELNERVVAIEDGFKGKNDATGDLIVEKVERVRRELDNLDVRIDAVEDRVIEDLESTAAKLDENISNSSEKQTQEKELLLELVKVNETKLKEVNAKLAELTEQKEVFTKSVPDFKCDECGKSFQNKIYRKTHISQHHPKQFICVFFDLFSVRVGDTKLT